MMIKSWELQFSNLPLKVYEEELRLLLHFQRSSIEQIIIVHRAETNNSEAWVRLNISREAAVALANKFDGRYWHGQRIRSYAALFGH
ncbi:RNA-binding protein [Thalassotalea fonticola]|uniref:RNA-binding protein n=1 Tax=Thalassotalea fonticola TaxID=3065649 RepID=A0ABZ0GNS6_9GAMM|nr:RNA-binding protein [Colwelliaceae bacterium S1-1]